MKAPRNRYPSCTGFTLMESLIVIALVVLLLAFALPVFGRYRQRVLQAADANRLRNLGLACEQFSQDHRNYLIMGLDRHNFFGYNTPSSTRSWMRLLQPYIEIYGKLDPVNVGQSPVLISPADPSKGGAQRLGPVKLHRSYAINSRTEFPNPQEDGSHYNIPINKLEIKQPGIFIVLGNYDISLAGDSANINGGFSGGSAADSLASIPKDWYGNGTANFYFLDGHIEAIPWEEVQKGKARYYHFDRILNRPTHRNRPNSGFR